MAAKKEKSPNDLVMDLATKLKGVFKKDLYIKDSLYILPGHYTDDDLCGDILCVMELQYKKAIREVFGIHDLIHIDDLVDYKQEPDNHYTTFTKDDTIYSQIEEKQNKIKTRIDSIDVWEDFISSFQEEILESIFNENTSVDLKIDQYPAITVAKKLFPQVSLKNIDNLSFSIIPLRENELYDFCMDFQFTHFKIYMIYHYLKLED